MQKFEETFGEKDMLLEIGTMQFNRHFYLKRISRYKWGETAWYGVKDSTYDYSVANRVVRSMIEKVATHNACLIPFCEDVAVIIISSMLNYWSGN
jgi:hypothetical protein